MTLTPPFNKILIANRGEIAVRIMRACRELGVKSVAVYSEADAHALHVQMADEAILLGPANPAESYLDMEKVIDAARQSGANAIHPGYGFLSENAQFAQKVQEAGLVFIGPSPSAIETMGDKGRARDKVAPAGVPLVPGHQGDDDPATLAKVADEIGYPVLVKAAAGGGGKGMRVVNSADTLAEGIAAARREALHAFGDERLILEKYVDNARHIEIQILADAHGNTLHLFERECSVQRRHQKIIEETPSPLLDDALRAEMGAAAVAAAQSVGYVNAGTVEFIVDPETREFYFLEMNTRLQVEHPITELVTGLDLAQWQLRIAAGEPLPMTQAEIKQVGHAIECRLYAEDPGNNFFPSTGNLLKFETPNTPGVRTDSGVQSGDEVTVHYDPLLAKLIVHGETREAALRKMQTALAESVVLGLTTNKEFLQDVLTHEVFVAGTATTRFIEKHMPDWQREDDTPVEALIAAALAELQGGATQSSTATPRAGVDPYSPWERLTGFRMEGGR